MKDIDESKLSPVERLGLENMNALPPCEMWREAEDEPGLNVKTIVLWMLVEFIWGVCVGAFLMFLIRR